MTAAPQYIYKSLELSRISVEGKWPLSKHVPSTRCVKSDVWRQSFLVTLLVTVAAAPGALAEGAVAVSQSGDWSLMTDDKTPKQTCFVTSEPKEMKPAAAKRDIVRIYISAWPKEGVKAEVSVKQGYPISKDNPALAIVDQASFRMFAKDERLFVADATQELKLVEAMKKGATLNITSTSERGTQTTDTYSLAGIAQALTALAANCP